MVNNKLPITVFITAYNEEHLIERCIRSCIDIVDELIVCHDGPCRDKTIEIAKKYTDKILIREHKGIPEPHQVFMIDMAKNDWVMRLDTDEWLSDELRANLPHLISDPEYKAYDLLWPTFYKGKYYHAYTKLSLANKRFFYYLGITHANFTRIDPKTKIKKLSYGLHHQPAYDNLTLAKFKSKWLPWIKIEAQDYVKGFQIVTRTANCPITDWEPRLKWRIDNPITLGIFGSAVYHLWVGLKDFIKTREVIFLKSGFLMSLYHVYLYYYVWLFKRQKLS